MHKYGLLRLWDAMHLRYNWPISNLPENCGCSDDHAMSCKNGGFVAQRHNDLRDIFRLRLLDHYTRFVMMLRGIIVDCILVKSYG